MTPDDVLRLTVPNRLGQAVPLSSFASTRWVQGPTQTVRYNGFLRDALFIVPAWLARRRTQDNLAASSRARAASPARR